MTKEHTKRHKLSLSERLDMADEYHANNQIIQGEWHRIEDGRDMVCALGAFGWPGEITHAKDCPADLMPQWMAELVPVLDDGIDMGQVSWFSGELIARARRWSPLDSTGWNRIQTGFLIGTIRQMLDSARLLPPDSSPPLIDKVIVACEQVAAALESGCDLEEATAEVENTRDDIEWLLDSPRTEEKWAEAATASARAAAEVSCSLNTATAAWAAAQAGDVASINKYAFYKRLAEILFNVIDSELAAHKSDCQFAA